MDTSSKVSGRGKRIISVLLLAAAIIVGTLIGQQQAKQADEPSATMPSSTNTIKKSQDSSLSKYHSASQALEALQIKGRAPKTGYSRNMFGNGWEKSGTCDTRNRVLARDLKDVVYKINSCVVLSGKLNDPYTGKEILFVRGKTTSAQIQIDHIVALSDAWQKGAQLLTPSLREKLANDGLELLAVDGPTNQNKGDGDAATWLPPNKSFRCGYVARQITVKLKYSLWVSRAEHDTMSDILKSCPNQELPR